MIEFLIAVALLAAFGAVYGAGRADGEWVGWTEARKAQADQQTEPLDLPRDEHGRWTDASGGKRA
jgi:hypothetical protein